ncbi:uncharacterized protein BDR25DRAFT_218203 [Lindgomyces ingoldianus]|uniref:Uncharacterized protein n=1 Tax=Lindgomyces ingoldianus TaxID=673940 RepID=A0ACB6R282_9PLEO|nr:uncharacterized protein BDR25DRAFT_218203 [Lindgomyces ingoldianus]KAF2473205.1 hypothetical protein BDR25DRAFT_218203 [Lindgomyces ingoldianus]
MDGPYYERTCHPWRRRPAEYLTGVGWIQGGHKRRKLKPYYHFVWPRDGKNGSTWGRWKDILKGQGPDIHVTISADKKDYMFNRQTKERWAGHTNLDDRGPDGALKYEPPWTRSARPGNNCRAYDFRTRKYCRPYDHMWTDALWQDEPNGHFPYPHALRNVYGEWIQHKQNAFEEEFGM